MLRLDPSLPHKISDKKVNCSLLQDDLLEKQVFVGSVRGGNLLI